MTRKFGTGVLVAGLLVGATIAVAPALGKGKPPKTGVGCKPQIALIVSGTVVGAPSGSTFTMAVTRANHHASALVSGTQLTIRTNADTKIVRIGRQTSLSTFVNGDVVQAQYRLCKGDIAALTPASFNANTTMFAKRVTAHAPGTDTNENENENGS
jgi:hypothetical protein